jgi:hypothetical protein
VQLDCVIVISLFLSFDCVFSAIGAMSSETDGQEDRLKLDKVFAEAVRLGAVLGGDPLGRPWQFDLTSMSFPVARYVVSTVRWLVEWSICHVIAHFSVAFTFVGLPAGSYCTESEIRYSVVSRISPMSPLLLGSAPSDKMAAVRSH